MKIPKSLRDWLIFIKLLKKLESGVSTDNTPSAILSKETFQIRLTSLKMKQINAPQRFTKAVFICSFKIINVSPPFKTKSSYKFTNKTTQLSINPRKIKRVLTKARNELKRSKTTQNDLKRPKMIYLKPSTMT